MKALIGQSNDDVCQYPVSYGKGGGSRFLGDAHATSLMGISIAELRSAGRARAPVPTWALLAGGEAACFYVGIADPTADI